jgi:hypothetical protein
MPKVLPTPAAPADDFDATLRAMGLELNLPGKYSPVPIRENNDVAYDKAFRDPKTGIEIRITLRPYEEDLPLPTRNLDFSRTFFMTGILNLTHGNKTGSASPLSALPAEMFNADDAAMLAVRWKENNNFSGSFGEGFRAALAVFLNKEKIGDAYIFFLFADPAQAQTVDEKALQVLRFAADNHPKGP